MPAQISALPPLKNMVSNINGEEETVSGYRKRGVNKESESVGWKRDSGRRQITEKWDVEHNGKERIRGSVREKGNGETGRAIKRDDKNETERREEQGESKRNTEESDNKPFPHYAMAPIVM